MNVRQLFGCGGIRHGQPIESAAANNRAAAWDESPRWDGLTHGLKKLGDLIGELPKGELRTDLERRHTECADAVRDATTARDRLASKQGLAMQQADLAPNASDYLAAARAFENAVLHLDALTSQVEANGDKLKPHWSKTFFRVATVVALTLVAVAIGVLAAPLVPAVVAGAVAAGTAYAVGAGIAAGLAGGSYLAGMIAAIRDLATGLRPATNERMSELKALREILGAMKARAIAGMAQDRDGAVQCAETLLDSPSGPADLEVLVALASELPSHDAHRFMLDLSRSPVISSRQDLAACFADVIGRSALAPDVRQELVAEMMAVRDASSLAIPDATGHRPPAPYRAYDYPGEGSQPPVLGSIMGGDGRPSTQSAFAAREEGSPAPIAEPRAQQAGKPAKPRVVVGEAKALAAPIVVRVWAEHLMGGATGHAAMTIHSRSGQDPLYISPWPPSAVPPAGKRHYLDDKRALLSPQTKERLQNGQFQPWPEQKQYEVPSRVTPGLIVQDWGLKANKVYLPQYGENRLAGAEDTVQRPRLFGLNGAAMQALAATKSPEDFTLISAKNNCAGMVFQLLRAGGAAEFGTMPILKLVAKPSQALKYARKLVERIDALNQRADELIERHANPADRNISLQAAWKAYEAAGGKSLQQVISAQDIQSTDALLLMRKAKVVMNMERIATRKQALAVLCGLRNRICELSREQAEPGREPAAPPREQALAQASNFGEGSSSRPANPARSDSWRGSDLYDTAHFDPNPDVGWGDLGHAVEKESSLAPREGFDPAEEYRLLSDTIAQRHREISDRLAALSGQPLGDDDGRETRMELNEMEADLLAFTIALRNAPTHFMAMYGVGKVAAALKSVSQADDNGIRIRQNIEDPASFIPMASLPGEYAQAGETLQGLFDACEDLALKIEAHKQLVYTREPREMLI